MLLKILEYVFVVESFLFAIALIMNKMLVSKITDNAKMTQFVIVLGSLLLVYIVLALSIGILSSKTAVNIVMVPLGLSPFVIGKISTYKTEGIYTTIQILCIILGGIFIATTIGL
jgi:hypothetical protein